MAALAATSVKAELPARLAGVAPSAPREVPAVSDRFDTITGDVDTDPGDVDIDSILGTEAPYTITDQPPSRVSRCFGPFGSLWFCPRPGVNVGYDDCADVYIDDIGISEDTRGSYDTIRVAPTGWARLLVPGSAGDPTLAVDAGLAYLEMVACLDTHDMGPDVRSWVSILQQLHCVPHVARRHALRWFIHDQLAGAGVRV